MDHDVRRLYLNLTGLNKSPKQIFNGWVKWKKVCTNEGITFSTNNLYPEWIRMAIRYEVK